jgi:chromosome segregation ATPase
MVAAEADRVRREAAEAEVVSKRAEVAALVEQNRALTSAVAQLAGAQADVAGFRRETVQVLGTRLAGQTEEAEALRRELAIVRADLEKKDLELGQLRGERDRLGGVIRRLGGPR